MTVLAEDSEPVDGTETVPEPSPDAAGQTEDVKDAAQMVIDYLEGVRQEELEEKRAQEELEAIKKAEEDAERIKAEQDAEQQAAEEEEQAAELRSIAIEQDRLNATYTSNSNVILGYAEKYKYYYAYDIQYNDGFYTRTNRYIYCWDGYPNFQVNGNALQFDGDCIFVTALYSGDVSLQTVSGNISIAKGSKVNEYSNIAILAYPSLYQINKSSVKVWEEHLEIILMYSALLVGWYITKRFIIDG